MKKHLTVILETEAGNVLVIVALMMVVLLLMTALVIDVGNLFYRRAHLQSAADAAALAAAAEGALQGDVTKEQLETIALAYVIAHGLAEDRLFLTYPAAPDTNTVKVLLTAEEPLFFGPLVNITSWSFGMQSTAQWVYGGNIALIPNPE
jgi:Flp pilus assembly protein TadG